MNRSKSMQGLALTAVLVSLAGCDGGGDHQKKKSEMAVESMVMPTPIIGMLTDQMSDTNMTTDEKIHMLASQLDAISMETVHGTVGGKSPSHTADGSGFLITGDFLWWRADETGLEFGIKYKHKNPTGATGPFTQEEIDVGATTGDWKPGFRVGLGGMIGSHDQWDIYLNWTHYESTTSHRMSVQNNYTQFLTALWIPQLLTGDFLNSAHGHWGLKYNTIDFELGRDYFISSDITVRPHLGMRGAQIQQDMKARYDGQLTVLSGGSAATFTDLENHFHGDNDYISAGMRAGADFVWHFSPNIGLFGQISGALVYGKFELKQKVDTYQNSSTGGTASIATLKMEEKRNLWRTRTNLQGSVGLTFEELFHLGQYRFSLNLAYEFMQWFEQNMLNNKTYLNSINNTTLSAPAGVANVTTVPNQRLVTDLATKNGDLGMQGFTANLQLEF